MYIPPLIHFNTPGANFPRLWAVHRDHRYGVRGDLLICSLSFLIPYFLFLFHKRCAAGSSSGSSLPWWPSSTLPPTPSRPFATFQVHEETIKETINQCKWKKLSRYIQCKHIFQASIFGMGSHCVPQRRQWSRGWSSSIWDSPTTSWSENRGDQNTTHGHPINPIRELFLIHPLHPSTTTITHPLSNIQYPSPETSMISTMTRSRLLTLKHHSHYFHHPLFRIPKG